VGAVAAGATARIEASDSLTAVGNNVMLNIATGDSNMPVRMLPMSTKELILQALSLLPAEAAHHASAVWVVSSLNWRRLTLSVTGRNGARHAAQSARVWVQLHVILAI